MVIEMDEKNPLETIAFENSSELESFQKRLSELDELELKEHICLSNQDVMSMLSETTHCVGCRRR